MQLAGGITVLPHYVQHSCHKKTIAGPRKIRKPRNRISEIVTPALRMPVSVHMSLPAPHTAAHHLHLLLQAASRRQFHHLARLVELLHQPVHVGKRRAAATRYAFAP